MTAADADPSARGARAPQQGESARLHAAIVPVTPLEQNCALLWDPSTLSGSVIDPGGDARKILDAISKVGMKAEAIYLTHGHFDHVGGAHELREALDVPVRGPHRADEPICSQAEQAAKLFGIGDEGIRSVAPDEWLEEGDAVEIAGFDFEVLHCPGHSPGHVIFHSPELRFAHLGDVLFSGSIGRTDLPGGNRDELLESIRAKVLPLGDDVSFLCGHGPGGTIGNERRTNPFLVH